MTRRCSHCSNHGHNSRTCPNRGVKLFGVQITDGLIRKSASMGNLTHYTGSGSGLSRLAGQELDPPDHGGDGYGSEDFVSGSSSSRERKKGVPWTEDEHRMFLLGLQKLGKGDWRGIARNYVITKTPTQVASHAQKYFIRQTLMSRRKRRCSLFDIVADESHENQENQIMTDDLVGVNPSTADEAQCVNPMPILTLEEECESMDLANSNDVIDPMPIKPDISQGIYPIIFPAYISPIVPFPIPFWSEPNKTESHEVLKPTAVHSKNPINVDELVGMSNLRLGDSIGTSGPTSLSLKLSGTSNRQSAFHASHASGPSSIPSPSPSPIPSSSLNSNLSLKLGDGPIRQSAFHGNPASGSSSMNPSNSPIHAV